MMMGIDLGSSITDIVIMDKKRIVDELHFSNLIKRTTIIKLVQRLIKNKEINQIYVTGAYARNFKIKDIKANKIDEIKAIGKGGLFLAGVNEGLVVSIGSGTAMVSAKKNNFRHVGGTAIGGKTLEGLGKLILDVNEINQIGHMADKGKVNNVDLMIGDIYPKGIGLLGKEWSAAHMGKLESFNKNDLALGLVNMLAQAIGSLAVFAAKAEKHKKIVITGRLTQIPAFQDVIKKRINVLSDIPVVIPKNSFSATAVGTCL